MSLKWKRREAPTTVSANVSGCVRRGVAWRIHALACGLPIAMLLMLSACSSSSKKVQIGPIAFTDANGNELGGTHTSMTVGGTAYVDVALANDAALLGADWTVVCGSALPPGSPLPPGVTVDASCGTFAPVHTASAPVPQYASSGAGVVSLYTAPAAPPKGGVVTLYASATADHSKYSTVTLTIVGLPISIAFAPAPPSSLVVNATASLKAVLTNDYAAGGVNWSVSCSSSACGSFSAAKTASGIATTYTAPAAVPVDGSVVVTATSVTDPTKSVSARISIAAAQASLRGQVASGFQPVVGASVFLYAAGEQSYGSAASLLNDPSFSITGEDGSFAILPTKTCPDASSELYLVARGGDAGQGMNSSLALMTPLGPCSSVSSLEPVTVNEVTTVVSAYALSRFALDGAHIGAPNRNRAGLANAFASVSNLVDVTTGRARSITPAGNGTAPLAKIDALANALHQCASSAGGVSGDGSPCGDLVALTGKPAARDTLQAMLFIAHHATDRELAGALFRMGASSVPFEPTLGAPPADWRIALTFTAAEMRNVQAIQIDAAGNAWIVGDAGLTELENSGGEAPGSPYLQEALSAFAGEMGSPAKQAIDSSGNLWVLGEDSISVTEFVGGAVSPAGERKTALDSGIIP